MIKPEDILADFELSVKYLSPIHKCMESDFEYEAGKQWKTEDVTTLAGAGVKALTINKLRPIIKLMTGIERQSKSDFVAFPEGDEDGLTADIVTGLLKNVVKQSKAERKLSTQFKRGVICGMDFIEPYVDYTYDMVNGELFLRNLNPMRVFFDPDCEEYDLSDGRFLIKYSPNLTKDQLYQMFPNKKAAINKLEPCRIDITGLETVDRGIQTRDYEPLSAATTSDKTDINDYGYDLLTYQYKSSTEKYFIVDKALGVVQEVDTKSSGQEYISKHPDAQLIEKTVPELRCAYLIGSTVVDDEVLWTYPNWKSWAIIPYFADWLTVPLDQQELQIQGIVRNLKDLQEEYNKRRTQELRHLNSSVNSGMMYPKGSLSENEKVKVKKYGSSPGIDIEYDSTVGKPEKILPTPLSQAHAQLAVENAQDLKEASGVNPDLLANADTSQSGRAILLKQKQGLVMVQEYLDNYSETKRLLGRFLLTQLSEVFTVETAIKVLGPDFLKKYQEFQTPQLDQQGQPQLGPDGKLLTQVDNSMVGKIFNQVLTDSANISKYDVSIGEGAYAETTKMANYLTLMDMVSKGIPIPPEVLISESQLAQGNKVKIMAAIEAMQAAQAAQQQLPIKGKGDANVAR